MKVEQSPTNLELDRGVLKILCFKIFGVLLPQYIFHERQRNYMLDKERKKQNTNYDIKMENCCQKVQTHKVGRARLGIN